MCCVLMVNMYIFYYTLLYSIIPYSLPFKIESDSHFINNNDNPNIINYSSTITTTTKIIKSGVVQHHLAFRLK